MLKARTIALVAAVLGLVGAVGSTGMAGPEPPPPNPNWFNDPVEGPSPNLTHEVGNEEGGECPPPQVPQGFGRTLLGQGEEEFGAIVRLRNRSDTETIEQAFYPSNDDGFWGGIFSIPPGLAPGVYPLKASCIVLANRDVIEAGGFGGPVSLGGLFETFFQYEDRSYTVLAEREPARPVVRVVTFTG